MSVVELFEEIALDKERNAVLSSDEQHRYWLHQRRAVGGEGWTVFCMLNPSKANKHRADPTSRRTIEFATRWDRAGVALVNLYSAITSEPDDLYDIDRPVGARNSVFIRAACNLVKERGGEFVCAWGNHNLARLQSPIVLNIIRNLGVPLRCLGVTKDGMPRHPLYISGDVQLETYHGR